MYAKRFDNGGAAGGSPTSEQLNLGLFEPVPEAKPKLEPEPESAPQPRAGMVVVSRDEFFAYVGPRDIITSAETTCSIWETRGRMEVGRTYPGYTNPRGPKAYLLTDAAYAAIKGK